MPLENNLPYSILVNTCDQYSDIWPMFFFLLKENWEGDLPQVYLNTETKSFSFSGVSVVSLNLPKGADAQITWGERLLTCLRRIDSKYVLMLLEDFYFERQILSKRIEECVRILENQSNISHIQFVPAAELFDPNYSAPELFPGMMRRKRFTRYTIIAGPTLWRKDDLIRLTSPRDTPWDWEYFGSFRTWFYGKEIYGYNSRSFDPIFLYDVPHGGAVHRGAWVGYKIEELKKKYELDFDYGTRPVVWDWLKDGKEDNGKQRKPISLKIKNSIKKVFNILYGMVIRVKID